MGVVGYRSIQKAVLDFREINDSSVLRVVDDEGGQSREKI